MTEFSFKFKTFAKKRMLTQGDEIRRWINSTNPLLVVTCRDIIEAAGQAQAGRGKA